MENLANKGNKMKAPIKHDEWLFIQLKDADFAAEFLNAASQDDDPKTYLIALRTTKPTTYYKICAFYFLSLSPSLLNTSKNYKRLFPH